MDDLIKALQIFRKYTDDKYPTTCEHDVLYFVGVDPHLVSGEDRQELESLGFLSDGKTFYSYRFGSS